MAIAYIIDDEKHAALLLKNKLLAVTDYFDDVELFTKPTKAFQAIHEKKPDLIFSDIEMPLMRGVDLHQMITDLDIPFIYVTAYSSYSIQALKLQAFDYILKPVKEEEKGGRIDVIVSQQDDFLKIEINDNGIGFKKTQELSSFIEKDRTPFGLELTRRRLELFSKQSELHIIDLPQGGANVVIKIYL